MIYTCEWVLDNYKMLPTNKLQYILNWYANWFNRIESKLGEKFINQRYKRCGDKFLLLRCKVLDEIELRNNNKEYGEQFDEL